MSHLTSGVIGADLANPSTADTFAVGDRQVGTDGTEWVYVQASGAITQYDCVAIDEDYQAAAMTTALGNAGHRVGFAQAAFADDEYGWVAIGGSNITVRCEVATADQTLRTTVSAGVLSTASTASAVKFAGLVATTAVASTGSSEVIAANVHVANLD